MSRFAHLTPQFVKVDELLELDAIEVAEQRELRLGLSGGCGLPEVLDDDARVHLLLDIDRDDRYLEIGGVLLVLPFPDELGIEARIARVEACAR
jgi:hypothetical protein